MNIKTSRTPHPLPNYPLCLAHDVSTVLNNPPTSYRVLQLPFASDGQQPAHLTIELPAQTNPTHPSSHHSRHFQPTYTCSSGASTGGLTATEEFIAHAAAMVRSLPTPSEHLAFVLAKRNSTLLVLPITKQPNRVHSSNVLQEDLPIAASGAVHWDARRESAFQSVPLLRQPLPMELDICKCCAARPEAWICVAVHIAGMGRGENQGCCQSRASSWRKCG